MDIDKILVPVSGNHADAEIVRMACGLAEASDASIYVVYINEVERSLPVDSPLDEQCMKAEEILSQVESLAHEYGYDIVTGLIHARETGPAIVREAVEGCADVIVMSAEYHNRPQMLGIGNTVSYVLKQAPCDVILYRAGAPSTEKD